MVPMRGSEAMEAIQECAFGLASRQGRCHVVGPDSGSREQATAGQRLAFTVEGAARRTKEYDYRKETTG